MVAVTAVSKRLVAPRRMAARGKRAFLVPLPGSEVRFGFHHARISEALNSVAIGGTADIDPRPGRNACGAFDPSLHLAANFAVMHNAAFPTTV
jgi:hypothetical protein